MKVITNKNIKSMDKIYRLNLINSVTGFKSANMIGTVSSDGNTNLAIFSSVTHMGSDPAVIGFFVRPTHVPRNTYSNIKDTGYYTINHISKSHIAKAHQSSAKYDEDISEFEELGFSEEYSGNIKAPYVAESNIKIGMKYKEEYPIKVNNTVLVVGEIAEIMIPEEIISEDGHINLNQSDTVTISGLDAYHKPEFLKRFDYARPGKELNEITR